MNPVEATGPLDTHQKALEINLDKATYGTLAEIGAGQEVARWLFRVGGAAGTIAKAMSAYDMTFSDANYGLCERYVSRERLARMLDREYSPLVERLDDRRGPEIRFFVFADTVATRSFSRRQDGHGWLGVRFQAEPMAPPSEITIHVRLTDREMEQQQEALGIIGVNLVHAALFCYENLDWAITSLIDQLTTKRVEVDMIAIYSRDVLRRLRSGDAAWETMVPPGAVALIKERRLLGYDAGASEPAQAAHPSGVPSSS